MACPCAGKPSRTTGTYKKDIPEDSIHANISRMTQLIWEGDTVLLKLEYYCMHLHHLKYYSCIPLLALWKLFLTQSQ